MHAAEAAVKAATSAQRKAQAVHQDAAKDTAAASSSLAGTQGRLDKAAQVMADIPAEAELAGQLEAIGVADGP